MEKHTHRNSLKAGHRVGSYEIIAILGQGGFGITYLAKDINLDRKVAVKEYLPVEMVVREGNISVHPVSAEYAEQYRWGLERFISEAQTLARFQHPNIVRVLTVVTENNTAYIVMEYEQGRSLHEVMREKKTIRESELIKIVYPLLDGLESVHKSGFIHRDIKPPNIYIRHDGSPVLIDFGSARQSLFEHTRTLTTMVSPGYAPFEQYVGKSDKQGPWTDIYGLGATLYRAVTGVSPPDSMNRSEAILHTGKDIYVSAAEIAGDKYSPALLAAIDRAMAFRTDDRPQSVREWRKMIAGDMPVSIPPGNVNASAINADAETLKIHTGEAREQKSGGVFAGILDSLYVFVRKTIKWGAILLVILVVIGVLKNTRDENRQRQASQLEQETGTVPATESPGGESLPAGTGETGTPGTSRDERITRLLEAADRNIEALRLMTPGGDNALEKYNRILELDPGNESAIAGKNRIVDEYIALSDNAIENGYLQRAREFLRKAEMVNADHPAIAPAQDRLASALNSVQDETPASRTSTETKTDVQIPQGEREKMQAIREKLRVNPDDRQARRELRELASVFEENIRQAVSRGDYELARAYIYEVQRNTDSNSRAYNRLNELLKIIRERELEAGLDRNR